MVARSRRWPDRIASETRCWKGSEQQPAVGEQAKVEGLVECHTWYGVWLRTWARGCSHETWVTAVTGAWF